MKPWSSDGNELDSRTAHRGHAGRPRHGVARAKPPTCAGDLNGARDFRLFRELKPLVDPGTREVLGYEGRYVGTAEYVATGNGAAQQQPRRRGRARFIPHHQHTPGSRPSVTACRRCRSRNWCPTCRTRPAGSVDGRIVAVYGDGLRAGPEPGGVDQPRQQGRHRARPCAGAVACWRGRRWTRPVVAKVPRCACPTNATACCSCSAPSTACPTR